MTPNGRCYNLNYLSVLGQVGSSQGEAAQDSETEDTQSLPNINSILGEGAAVTGAIEDRVYPIHLRVMHEISGVFADRNAAPLTLQRLGLDR
jgi:hypothetical protein